MTSPADRRLETCSALLQLELEMREARTTEELEFIAVNRLLTVLPASAILYVRTLGKGKCRIGRASGVAEIDSRAPYIRTCEAVIERMIDGDDDNTVHELVASDLQGPRAPEWPDPAAPFGLWVPLKAPDGRLGDGLFLMRPAAWREAEKALATRLAGALSHARTAVLAKPRALPSGNRRRFILAAAVTAAVAMLFVPVRQSALAPATVAAKNHVVVTAPMDGFIDRVEALPNRPVSSGQILFALEQTKVRHALARSHEAMKVAEAELLKARRLAFSSVDRKAELAALEARVDQYAADEAYAQALLDRSVVRAPRDGIAIFDDPEELRGRPVSAGERIMLVANPEEVEVDIRVPVDDAILLKPGAEIVLYLDIDPLTPVPATLVHAGYEAVPTPEGYFAYPVKANIGPTVDPPRIGLHGTAKIKGETVSTFYHLFRRPLTALRRTLGW